MIFTLNPSQSVYVLERFYNTNYDDRDYLAVGVGSSSDRVQIALAQFNLAAYAYWYVASATLRMYSFEESSWTATTTQYAKRNTSSFAASSVTWNTKPSTTDTGLASMANGGYNEWYEWNVKSIVQSWLYGTANYGFSIMQAGSTQERTKCYKRTGSYAPQLVLDIVPAGVRYNSGGTWRQGMVYANYNGTWRQGLVYGNDGTWKLGG